MRTEEQIVYEILNIVHGGKVSNDDVISERLVRSFLRKHRATKLYEFSHRGADIAGLAFQDLGEVTLKKHGSDYRAELPALINLEHNFGIQVEKLGYNIPVVDSEAFSLSKASMFYGTHPKATIQGRYLIIYTGKSDLCNFFPDSPKEEAVSTFGKETEFDQAIEAEVKAVLYDPSQAPDYDWTRDPYPCPSEIIDQLTTSTLARDFNLMIRTQGDIVSNANNDAINYDDTKRVQ